MFSFIINLYTSKSLSDYYVTMYRMTRYSDLTLTEIENLIPYELSIYISILTDLLKEEKNARK